MDARLRTDVQVQALQRQVEGQGCFFSVLNKGHEVGGVIFIKWIEGRDVHLFTEQRFGDGLRWAHRFSGAVSEAEANDVLQKEQQFDPDLWIVEVMGSLAVAEALLQPLPSTPMG